MDILITWACTAAGGAEKSSIILNREINKTGMCSTLLVLISDPELTCLFKDKNIICVSNRFEYIKVLQMYSHRMIVSSHRTIFLDYQYCKNEVYAIFRGISIQGEKIRALASDTSSRSEFIYIDPFVDYKEMERVQWIAPSKLAADALSNALAKHVLVSPNGIDSPINDVSDATKAKKRKERLSCISVCRLEPWKNIEWLFQAVEGFDCTLKIFGDGTQKQMFENLYNTRDDIQIMGHHDNLDDIFLSADILIHAAKNEAFGRVAIEAAHYGIPSLVPSNSGISELIIPGKTGETYRYNDTAEFLSKLESMKIAVKRNRTKISEHCIEHAKKYSPKIAVKKLLQCLGR